MNLWVLQIVRAQKMRFRHVGAVIDAQMRPGGWHLRTDIQENPAQSVANGQFYKCHLRRLFATLQNAGRRLV